jgi:hypothetical protein
MSPPPASASSARATEAETGSRLEEARAATERGGQPIDARTRAFMEPRFGFDFRHVRIHTDAAAANAARSINAKAYTLGDSIAFGAGRYLPHTSEGRQLLAHELAHVVQQGATSGHVDGTLQRKEKPADLDAALRSDDTDELKPFRPFRGITARQLLSLVNLIVTQIFVTGTEESMLEEAWTSRGCDLESYKESEWALWKSGQNRGADPSKVQWLRDLRSQFAREVRAEARYNLEKNKETIEAEARKLGIGPDGAALTGASADADAAVRQQQREAKKVKDIKDAMRGLRSIEVGYAANEKKEYGGAARPGGG